jgi:hypothetical protein
MAVPSRSALPAAAMAIVATWLVAGSALAGAGSPAAGAPRTPIGPMCRVLTDPAGDANNTVSNADPGDNSQLDIIGGYFQVTPSTLTTVVRVTALTAEDIMNPQGRVYEFDFTVGSQNFITIGSLLPGGSEFDAFISAQRLQQNQSGGRAATGIGTMTGRLDLQAHEVILSGPLSMFQAHANFDQGSVTYFAAFTYKANGESMSDTPVGKTVDISGSLGIGVDQAWSHASYDRFTRSCARAVRGPLY